MYIALITFLVPFFVLLLRMYFLFSTRTVIGEFKQEALHTSVIWAAHKGIGKEGATVIAKEGGNGRGESAVD